MAVSIDIGGTFTDFVLIDEDIDHFKVPSTPDTPEEAISEGLKRDEAKRIAKDEIFHGTTIATNAFLEKKGIETAFITNSDFEDILFIGRQTRPELYELDVEKKKPPLKKENIFGLSGRIGPHGEEIREISREKVEKIAEQIKEKDLSAAVCLLHSYKDPKHEREVGNILEQHDISHSLSSEVTGEFREYERGMTTLLDAHLTPLLEDYFSSLIDILGKEPYIMKSGGGLEKASEVDAVDTLLSGPAGGVAGGAFIAEELGLSNLVTFDMGGTSADMSTIMDEEITWKDEGEIGGFPVQSKMVDLVTVGSGGGSIARKDEGGALRVGPESAGAEPGPICYGRGGEKPTVTDALLLMGYIDPNFFLGGKIELEIEKARDALQKLSDRLDMGFEETLSGIFRVANSTMARTMKKITVERGLDPKDFSILAFGGAGPLHAAFLAEELGMKRVVVPPMAGVFSALGMVTGDVVHDHSRTVLTSLDDKAALKKTIEELREKKEGEGEENILFGLRYQGQSYHINIPLKGTIEEIETKFHEEHERKYGYSNRDQDIEVVRVHLEVKKKRDVEDMPFDFTSGKHPHDRECLFAGEWKNTTIYYHEHLSEDQDGEGPSIIQAKNSTILVPPGWAWNCLDSGIVTMEDKR